ncbi:putative Ig domain-containing protein [Cellulomonas sp. C5510]|uniref:putative Ig domain-containing protein n=1 Tax=Cellulomonas sp. C5510 TaxID=2871170 RepID=UPI001C940C76|nr:putative Ig domain-containing protein [Cellulomonas sp. C5510]QZN85414.1 putative Ig domain-containing protein [Cellulomonas sp. C5510]
MNASAASTVVTRVGDGRPGRATGPARRAVAVVVAALVAVLTFGTAPAHAARTSLVVDEAIQARLGSGFDGTVLTVTPLDDGGYVVGGLFWSYQGTPVGPLVRLDADLELDHEFSERFGTEYARLSGVVRDVEPLDDGGFLVAGDLFSLDGVALADLIRLDADLRLDTDFQDALGGPTAFDSSDPSFGSAIETIAPEADGGLLVGGAFDRFRGEPVGTLVRLDADLRLDPEFAAAVGTGFDGSVEVIVPTSDGGYVVGGSFDGFQGTPSTAFARLGADLRLDTEVAARASGLLSADSLVTAISEVEGGYLFAGRFTTGEGAQLGELLRLDTELRADLGFTSVVGRFGGNASGLVEEVVVLPDGGYLVAGDTSEYRGTPVGNLVVLRYVTVDLQPVPDRFGSPEGDDVVGFPVAVQLDATVDPAGEAVVYAASGLPSGVTLDPTTGLISGTPTTDGLWAVFASAKTPGGAPDQQMFLWAVEAARAATIQGDPAPGVLGETYEFAFDIGGAPAPGAVEVVDGSVPDGLALSATGVLAGVPTRTGQFTFTLAAANGVEPAARRTVTLHVTRAPIGQVALEVAHAQRLAGEQQTVAGTGFAPGEGVELVLSSVPHSLGTVAADDAGEIRLQFDVPAGTPAGRHTVTATAVSGAASVDFEVVAHEPTDPAPTDPTPTDPAPAPTEPATPSPGDGDGTPSGRSGVSSSGSATGAVRSEVLATTGAELAPWGAGAAVVIALGLLLVRHRRRAS